MTELKRRLWKVCPDIGGGDADDGSGIGLSFTGADDGQSLDIIIPYEGLNALMLAIFHLSHKVRHTRIEKGLSVEPLSAYEDPHLALDSLRVAYNSDDPAKVILVLETKSGMVLNLAIWAAAGFKDTELGV